MCYSTKRKIADCVKELMYHKEIRKITIQDIMTATNMSRQSFYYHFKDIYDVLEWIAIHDFAEAVNCNENSGLEEWVLQLVKVIEKDKFFYDKIVREIEWPKILQSVKKPIEWQIKQMYKRYERSNGKIYAKEWQFCVDFISTSFSYYMLDYIYQRKHLSDEEIIRDFQFMTSVLNGSQLIASVDYIGTKVAAS